MDIAREGERGMYPQEVQAYSIHQVLQIELGDRVLDGFLPGDQAKEIEQRWIVELQRQRQLRLVPAPDLVTTALKPPLAQVYAGDQG